MRHEEKQQVLEKIASENEFRTELMIPLLKKMRAFSDVLDNQGPDEDGVDVIAVSTSPFKKPEYTAFILKKGKINQNAADKNNNLINILETQIRTAMNLPLSHPRLPNERCFANRFVVATNGTISKGAERALRKTVHGRTEIDIDFVGQDRLIDQLDDLWPEFYEDRRPFLSSYAQSLFDSLNIVNLELLGYAQKERSLEEIYIDALLYEEVSVASNEFAFDKETILGEQLCKQKHGLVAISSGPGGGKTTLLKEIAITESRNDKECAAVYLHARDVLEAKDLLRKAAEILSRLSTHKVEDVYRELQETKLLLLVDGLDELASLSDREAVIARVIKAHNEVGARVIIGTRPESNPQILAALAGFKSYSISPLRKRQIQSFFGKWFKGNIDKAGKLLKALEDKGIFDKLPRTPMTMTLVAIVYESKEDIPSTLTELYEMFVDLLTGKWDANRKIASAFDSPIKLSFLNRLARVMHSERLDTISQDRCIGLAKDFFENEATLENVDAKAFIQSIIDRSHIVVPTGTDQLRFSHRTFQEYFCAENLFQEFPSTDAILSWFGDDWWSEVLFFLAGKRKDISKVIDALLLADYDDPYTRTTRLITLGSMLQAGYLTSAPQKTAAITFAAERFFSCYDDFLSVLQEAANPKLRRQLSRVMLVDLVRDLFTNNFTSKYLQKSLEDAYRKMPSDKEHEGARFFVACALANLSKVEPILEFATNPRMIDTSMYLLANSVLDKKDMSENQQEKYRRLRKRLEGFKKSIKRELRGPVLKAQKK